MGKVVKSILSRVVDNNIDVKNLFEGSKEGDEDMEKSSKDSSKVCEKEDKSAIGVKIDCVGCIFMEVTTIVEKTIDSRKEDTTSDGDEEVLEKKEVIVLGSMNEDDELLNQQKTQKGGVSKSVKSQIQDVVMEYVSLTCGIGGKGRNKSGTKCKFKRRKLRFDIWKWPMRKKKWGVA
ncbi:hypothetical protein Tco_1028597 [Tanacetum coccineum]|uniref:Uncharacterized protein n=1 Tax=Tanacetum coccineum TaxID=301880 RepID=A0ABQ5G1B1_9ASTR